MEGSCARSSMRRVICCCCSAAVRGWGRSARREDPTSDHTTTQDMDEMCVCGRNDGFLRLVLVVRAREHLCGSQESPSTSHVSLTYPYVLPVTQNVSPIV
eukprot:7184210-Prymnesium_polylepis.1